MKKMRTMVLFLLLIPFFGFSQDTSKNQSDDLLLDESEFSLDEEELDEDMFDASLEEIMDEEGQGVKQVRLLGPLRRFSIRYRIPDVSEVDSEDEEENWESNWDVEAHNGQYPSAIEFILFYEVPGVTDDFDTEELEGVRMVIPVYSTNNLDQRGSNHGAFFDEE